MAMLICAVSSVKIWLQVEKVSPAFLHKQCKVLHGVGVNVGVCVGVLEYLT
jgi:hypothetical protein